ncbi:tetratricopeptide repeat protein [Burkholderia sp. MSMB1078WGS]|uniref:tetratricopeptide repeat protein n=1 Tax=Burkholderia sp. MSMB1078WGS TaxID=1637900 RepID=UPI0009E69B2F|nr:tetratricopeptide repeat protein [Burkholderia sp. MSMB1078WGS]
MLQQLAIRFRAAMSAKEFVEASSIARQALCIAPDNMGILSDYALSLMRSGAYVDAYAVYKRIHDAPPLKRAKAGATWLHGFAEVCGWLGRDQELRRHGHRALVEADIRFQHGERWTLPAFPSPFDPSNRTQNVIAYSLFGANPRYCESAVMNAQIALELFPRWTCRFYLDRSVPMHVQHRLSEAGADLVDMTDDSRRAIQATLWRFLVIDDVAVRRFMVRDADSLLSERDAAAVEEWLVSNRFFHHMRDYFTHTELLLAGLWGGCTGVLPRLTECMMTYSNEHEGSSRFTDQHFLREILWPTVRESILNHDSLFGFHGALPFPRHAPVRWHDTHFHVGSNAAYQSIRGIASVPDGTQQRIELIWDGVTDVFYDAPVWQKEWRLELPFFLIDRLAQGNLKVCVH